ncbi:Na+/proline symporter [Mucilaginibacter yixingensis]|uniref:Na+/proline symporter n=1 Tax=Mucilaginibacter yixingensis TaxID=1295612 RepID=A0A2T5JAF7_9SPHI|nr:sodium:solute symporter [Mucilaginibacter yixingensis]PTQ97034.1 Na+/proline symporter [Mucilaginibacter yixingensis]
MPPGILLSFIIGYFLVLIIISWLTSRKSSDNDTFFVANRNSKWYLVAFGMIGTALSGVTFISVPGKVNTDSFAYFQFILGNAAGFIIIATVLLPLYYRMKLTSIYSYIEHALGTWSYKTAAAIFLVSRTIGSSFRLYLVVIVLQRFIFDSYHIPFAVTVIICLALIWSYTFKGGLKTIIITDSLQTFFLVSSVFLSIFFICRSLHMSIFEAADAIKNSSYSKIFFFTDFMSSKLHFTKEFLGGLFITVGMTGLDQDLMQKNLSLSNIKEAQKNMFSFTGVFVVINIFFLSVGALLYLYAAKYGIKVDKSDYLYPTIALNYLGTVPAIVFMLGLTAATFATTDSALTALTTSFCVDFLGFNKKQDINSKKMVNTRHYVHIAFSGLMLLTIILFNAVNNDAVVGAIFTVASYTYGPLLGLYSFGLFVKSRQVNDKLTPVVCVAAPAICYFLNLHSATLLGGYTFSNEIIIINGLITFIGLLLFSKPSRREQLAKA